MFGDIFDFLANSVLPIMKDSLISFREFVSIFYLNRVNADLSTDDSGLLKYNVKPKRHRKIRRMSFIRRV